MQTNFSPEMLKRAQAVGAQGARRNPLASFGSVADVDTMEIPALADCNPGLQPLEYNVVVAPAVMAEKIGSILLADESHERMELGLQFGRLISVSPVAFNYEHWPEGVFPPKPGDLIWFARHAGGPFTGRDGRAYRLIKDKDCIATIE